MPPVKPQKDSGAAGRGAAVGQQPRQWRPGQRAAASSSREFDGYTLPMVLDRVLAPPPAGGSCEPMCAALQVVRERAASDPSTVAKVGPKLAERASAWAAFLARVAHDEQNRLRRPALATISWLMAQLAPLAAVDTAFQLFILNDRFLQLLTLVTEAPVVEMAQTILHCCQSQRVIEIVVKNSEMPTILRTAIERLARLGPHYLDACTALVMLAANLIGRHPSVAADMVEARIDGLLCQVGLRNIPNLGTRMGIVSQRAVLYCLRFFVRIRRDNIPFCEGCLSMCAHSITALPSEATDLCGDVCAVVSDHAVVARSHPNIYLNVVALATRMPNMSRAHFVFRLLKGLLPEGDPAQHAGNAEFGFAAAMKLCRVGWLDVEPRPSPRAFRREAVAELLDLLIVCLRIGPLERFERRLNSSVMALLRDAVLLGVPLPHGHEDPHHAHGASSPSANGGAAGGADGLSAPSAEQRANLVKWARIQFYFALPTPVPGLCKFWTRLTPFLESGALSVADYNGLHPQMAPFDPHATPLSEARLGAHLTAVLQQLGRFEDAEGAARAAVQSAYVSDANRLLETVVAERLVLLNSRSEIEFRLVDSAARARLVEMRAVIAEEHQRFRQERVAEMAYLRQHLTSRQDAVLRLAADFARSETDDAQLPPHELADMRIYHRKVADRVRRGLKAEREARLSEVRWHAGQGNYLRHLLRGYLDAPGAGQQLSKVSHVQVQEEIVRGYGWYHMVQYRADEEEGGGGGGGGSTTGGHSRGGGQLHSATGGHGNGGDSARSSASASNNRSGPLLHSNPYSSNGHTATHLGSDDFSGVMSVPVLPVGTSEVYVSIVEEEEAAWGALRAEHDAILAQSRGRTAGGPQREEVAEALELSEEGARFIIQEETWRDYMLMREELDFGGLAEQWRTGVPLTVDELEQRSRATIEDKALRWLSATVGLVAVQREEAHRRAFIKTAIYNVKAWAERFELLGRATIEVEECRVFHSLLLQWREREMRRMLSGAEAMEREVLADLLLAGPDVPAELLMGDARLELEFPLAELDPFSWYATPSQALLYRRASSFYGGGAPSSAQSERIRRSGSSRSLSLVSDSFRASATAAALAVLREDTDAARPSGDAREKKKRDR